MYEPWPWTSITTAVAFCAGLSTAMKKQKRGYTHSNDEEEEEGVQAQQCATRRSMQALICVAMYLGQ
jgi:hypothetical protein